MSIKVYISVMNTGNLIEYEKLSSVQLKLLSRIFDTELQRVSVSEQKIKLRRSFYLYTCTKNILIISEFLSKYGNCVVYYDILYYPVNEYYEYDIKIFPDSLENLTKLFFSELNSKKLN